MGAGHSWSTVFQFWFHFLVFLPLLHLFNCWRRLTTAFSAPAAAASAAADAIEVRRILWRHNLRLGPGDAFEKVIHSHARFEDARDFAWKDPDVHLLHLSEKGAVFVRTRKGVEVYSSSVSPFSFISLVEQAVEFGVLPLDLFRRIATEEIVHLRSSKGQAHVAKKVVLIGCIARSGSTLTLQHFEDIPGCEAISEPTPFVNLAAMTVADASHALLFRHVLLFVVKALYRRAGVDIVAIKLPVGLPWLLADAMREKKMMPFDMKILFTYRDPLPAVNSWLRIHTQIHSDAQGFAKQLPLIGRLFPDSCGFRMGVSVQRLAISGLRRLVADEGEWQRRFAGWTSELTFDLDKTLATSTTDGREAPVGTVSLTSLFFPFYLTSMLTLLELRSRKEFEGNLLAIRYEELTTTPHIWTTKMLPFCEIEAPAASEAEASAAASAMQRDSQRQSEYSKKRMSSHSTKLSSRDVDRLDEIVRSAGFAGGIRTFEGPVD